LEKRKRLIFSFPKDGEAERGAFVRQEKEKYFPRYVTDSAHINNHTKLSCDLSC